jgi:hypothetical protein
MVQHGTDPDKPFIEIFVDEIEGNYEFYKAMSKACGKPLKVTRRPPVQPPNTIAVTRALVKTHQDYLEVMGYSFCKRRGSRRETFLG